MPRPRPLLRWALPSLLLNLSMAAPALAAGPTYPVGSLGPQSFHRTNFATQTTGITCRAKSVSQGTYDPVSQKTFIAYSAGLTGTSDPNGVPYSAVNPTVIAYNHVSGTWEGPVELFNVRGLPGATSDCHNYPQVVVDNDGYLHVIHSLHNSLVHLQHFTSRAPRSITSGWDRQEIPNTSHNTYGGAFKDAQGEIYVFYRSTYYGPPAGSTGPWYEPEMFVKRTWDPGTGRYVWTAPQVVVDPGRPSQFNTPEALNLTSIINDGGWNTIYVSDLLQDRPRNRLALSFVATYHHAERFGHRYFIYFDMTTDQVLTVGGSNLGSRVDRNEYTTGACCTVQAPPAPLYAQHLDANHRGLSQAIVFEDPVNGYPTFYYTTFESSNPGVGSDRPEYYQSGWDRFLKATWNGSAWVHTYVGGTADPNQDPFIQWDDIAQARVGVHSIFDAEYRADLGTTLLYVKTKWGGTRFWLDANNQPKPEYQGWSPGNYYQYPLRIFSSAQGWGQNTRVFADHPDWEVRGVSNFNLIPDAHPSMRAFLKVPKYAGTAQLSGTNFQQQFAIGADYVLGE